MSDLRVAKDLYHLILMCFRTAHDCIIYGLREISKKSLIGRVVPELVHHAFVNTLGSIGDSKARFFELFLIGCF